MVNSAEKIRGEWVVSKFHALGGLFILDDIEKGKDGSAAFSGKFPK